MLSVATIRNIEVVLVLSAALAASVFVPPRILLPMAAATLAGSVGGVLAVRWLLQQPGQSGNRRAFLLEIGMAIALVGLAALIVLLMEVVD